MKTEPDHPEAPADRQACADTGIYPPRTYLFLDDRCIERTEGARRVVARPREVGDGPVMKPEKPWEGVAFIFRNGLIYDREERVFKFWYPCHDPTLPDTSVKSKRRWAYAVSADGVAWTRPNLGLVAYGGSTANNLIAPLGADECVGLLWNVVKDVRDPDPARRYKAIGVDRHALRAGEITWTGPDGRDEWYEQMGSKIGCGLFVAYSSDGLRWTMKAGWCGSGALLMDGSLLHGYDARIGKWVLWQRPRIMPKYRTFGVSHSDDFERWTFPEQALAPDADDPPGMEFDHLATVQSPDGGYIGLVGASGYTGRGFAASEEMAQLVYSRDGRVWTRVSREPWLPRGEAGAWNDGLAVPINPVQVGDEVFVYYYGKNRGKIWGEPTEDGKRITASALGLVKLPRDRWVAMAPDGPRGEVRTPLICFASDRLRVNADAAGGSLRVELQDCQGRPVTGHALADCDPLAADALEHTVTWRGNADLSAIIGTARRQPKVGRSLRLRFALDRAHLFSFSC